MKTKLLAIFAVLIFGLLAKVSAVELADTWGWTTTQSTGVLISSNTPLIVKKVIVSTLTSTVNDYVLLVDTNPLAMIATSAAGGFVAPATYSRAQWIHPPIVFRDTTTANNGNSFSGTVVPFDDEGVLIKNGLVVVQTAVGGTVTVIWKKPKR